jgi:tetratricopeptide (TPR) repeat protein
MFKRGIIALLVIIATAIVFQSCGVTSPYVTGAKIDMQNGDNDKALEKLQLAIKANPNDHEAHYYSGKLYATLAKKNSVKSGEYYPKMVESLKKAVELNKSYDADAKAEIESAWIKVYKDAAAAFNSGMTFYNEDKEADYQKAFTLAKKKGELAIILTPERFENYSILIYSYYYLKDFDNALKHALTLQKIQPTDVQAVKNIAVIYFEKGDLEKANEFYNKVYQMNPKDKEAVLRIAAYNIEKEDFDGALNMYDAMLKIEPDNTDVLFNKGDLLYKKKKNIDGAIEAFVAIVDINPEDIDATLYLAELYYEAKKFDNIISLLEPNLDMFENDEEIKKSAYGFLFYSYIEKGDNVKAQKFYIE